MRHERCFERRKGKDGCDAASARLTYCEPTVVLARGSTLEWLFEQFTLRRLLCGICRNIPIFRW